MKTSATIGMMTLMALGVQPGQSREKTGHATVTVCVEASAQTGLAESIASSIFAGIGVRIQWRHGLRQCPAEAVIVTLTVDTPASRLPGSLAYARPFEGTHVQVFYDRITDPRFYSKLVVPKVLGHVLAHEIGHVLQGTTYHAAKGVMKANWTNLDLSNMSVRPLGFTPIDIDLIERGLAKRRVAAK